MTQHQQVKAAHSQQRIFPTDYSRDGLLAELVTVGAENYDQAVQIEALTRRVRELETRRAQRVSASWQARRVHARGSRDTCSRFAALAPFARRR